MSEQSEKVNDSGFRVHQLVTKPVGLALRFGNRLRKIGQELVSAPVRCVGQASKDFANECIVFSKVDPLASLTFGLPLGGGLALMGLTPFLVAGSFAVRLGKSTESMLGGIAMGTVGFLAGTLLTLWIAELALLWLLIEAMLVVSAAAARVQCRETAQADTQVQAA